MPKVKSLIPKTWEDEFRAQLAYGLASQKISMEGLAEKLNVSTQTVYNLRKKPSTMKLGTYVKIVRILEMDEKQVRRVTGARLEKQ